VKTALPLVCLTLLLVSAGCQQTTASRLIGTWSGVPDSRQALKEREQAREAKTQEGRPQTDVDVAEELEEEASTAPAPPTDLEALDFAILLKLDAKRQVVMQLAGEAQAYAGTWSIIETRPTGALIEITRLRRTADDKQEKRRFEVVFEGQLPSDGFRLKESGADPQFGQLYFSPATVDLPPPTIYDAGKK
jgi:hypothetical protein